MIWLYDRAICEDLQKSLYTDNGSVIKVIDPEGIVDLEAQISNDEISYPIIALTRDEPQIDRDRLNYTRLHTGVDYIFDSDKNELYAEKCMPISLSYELHILTTNTVDEDELIRELTFKYFNMYFLKIKLPYEGNRQLRFGVCMTDGIERESGTYDYINTGRLYEAVLHLRCEGCVIVTYTPSKLKRTLEEVTPICN